MLKLHMLVGFVLRVTRLFRLDTKRVVHAGEQFAGYMHFIILQGM
jgi:hypothetical protein